MKKLTFALTAFALLQYSCTNQNQSQKVNPEAVAEAEVLGTISDKRIALYIGNSVYPSATVDPGPTIKVLQNSPLTSPILGLLNKGANNPNQLVFNDAVNPVFNTTGAYIGSSGWKTTIQKLRGGGNIRELYLSFSTNGTEYMGDLISKDAAAAKRILDYIKNDLGFDGIDLDYEGSDFSSGSPPYALANHAIQSGLKITAAPYSGKQQWQSWVQFVQSKGGTVSWLNLQCYAGGIYNNPGEWLDIDVPILGGSCNYCGGPQTTCSPQDMEALFRLWRTGTGSVSTDCWKGTPNTAPLAIGGGFIWVYSSIKGDYLDYMNAVKNGLGM